ncbi:RDD family protein, partial [Actinomyces dentalis]|uniref:RDD family protein n=1 Tax=Actinomyces dentalis TaxID=272548 RepID=UPI0028E48525
MTTTPAPMSPAPPLPDGVVPAPGARRLGAFLIDAVLITVAYYGITAVALAMGLASGSIDTLMTMTTVSGLIVIALAAAMTAWLWTRGYTPGHRLLGLRWAAWDGAGPAGARSVGWYALAGLVGTPTLGVVPIITLLVTDPQGRNWIDRVCGTVVVIAGPAGSAAPRSGPVAVPGTAGMSRAPGAAGPVPAFVEDTQEQPALTASQLRDRLGAAATAGAASGPFAAPASAAALEPIGDGPLFAPPPAPTGPAAALGAGAGSPPAPAVGAGFISSVPWETGGPAASPAPAASAPSAPGAMPPVP